MTVRIDPTAGTPPELSSPASEASRNQILSSLPASELAAILEHSEEVTFGLRQRLFDAEDTLELVYFPLTAMASLVIVLNDGTTVEAMTVGREGFVGFPLVNDVTTARYRGICQIEGRYLVLQAPLFRSMMSSLPELARRVRRFTQFANEVVAQSAACNGVHTIEQRCARWLLVTADATGTTSFKLTQEFLAQMLAVRRPGVTAALGDIERKGLVSKRYGKITLVDVDGLKQISCECYSTIRAKAAELLS